MSKLVVEFLTASVVKARAVLQICFVVVVVVVVVVVSYHLNGSSQTVINGANGFVMDIHCKKLNRILTGILFLSPG